MKQLATVLLIFELIGNGFAQEQSVFILKESANNLFKEGDIENAIIMMERAKLQAPADISIAKDLCYYTFLKRDFARSMELGKELVVNKQSDVQSFQLLGLTYKAIAMYKECKDLYKLALQKFPKNGVIYNEYGELFALEKDLTSAIVFWEKGIQNDPNYSSNYFNATNYYRINGNWLRALLYGEIFVNLESFTTRTQEIKSFLPSVVEQLFSINYLNNPPKGISDFEKDIFNLLAKQVGQNKIPNQLEEWMGQRSRLMLSWSNLLATKFPFALFNQHQYLLNQGLFEAYHYWLFGTGSFEVAATNWQKNHSAAQAAWTLFQQSRVFKIPDGNHYLLR